MSQSRLQVGVLIACAVLPAYGKWKNRPARKNYNVAMLVSEWPKVKEFELHEGNADEHVKWGRDVRPGNFIAVRYEGSMQYQHIGALFSDANSNGFLDGADLVIHAGPQPLHRSYLREGNYDGRVVTIRPH